MSKKQAIINTFFQPKAKDFVLASEPLRIKQRSFLRTRINRNVNNNLNKSSSNIVISLLSSDEDDETTSVNETIADNQNNPSDNSRTTENDDTNRVCSSVDTSMKSDELIATAEFLDVVLQEENGSFDTKKNPLLEEFTDYKLSNFSSMVNWVINDDSNYHLFNEDDWTIIENFKSMSGKRSEKVNLQK